MLYDDISMSFLSHVFFLLKLFFKVSNGLVEKCFSLSPHVPLLCLLRFRERFSDIIGVDKWPHEIISSTYSFDPHGFCRKICCCMKVYGGWFNVRDFIEFVDDFLLTGDFIHDFLHCLLLLDWTRQNI